jgi:hypothetical protein
MAEIVSAVGAEQDQKEVRILAFRRREYAGNYS